MRELTQNEIKKIELDILIELDGLCRANHINYSITYGTLIGAIRHKGFIPWDDDIDVMMTRDDYEKFLSVWHDGKYKLFTLKKGMDFWPLFSRISDSRTTLEPPRICNHGIWVAVIPYDKIPTDEEERSKHLKKVKRYLKLLEIKRFKMSKNDPRSWYRQIIVKLVQILLLPVSFYHIGKKTEALKTKYRNTDSKVLNPWMDPIFADADIFKEYFDIEFEGVKVMAIKNYDKYLRDQYGDYMTPPPENERVCPHSYTAYINE